MIFGGPSPGIELWAVFGLVAILILFWILWVAWRRRNVGLRGCAWFDFCLLWFFSNGSCRGI